VAGTRACYSEHSVRLPASFWCYDPMSDEPAVNSLPAQTTGHVTFGCLNNFCKINTYTLALWAGVLRAVPDAHLCLLAPAGAGRAAVLSFLAGAGVAAERVRFADKAPRPRYLELYHGIDLGLDTLPYNGHT